jgi:phosphonoacetaldehyde hydrolase
VIHSLIFDLAGTTIDCGCMAPVGVFLEVFRRHGITLDVATARGPMGTHKREHIRLVMLAVADQWERLHGRAPTDADIDALYAEAEPLQIEVIPHHVEPIPGFIDVLSSLRSKGYRIGATTGYTAPMVAVLAPLITARGWTPDVLYSASDVPAGRPAPYMNWRAAMTLGAPSARACVVVGDTEVDMQAARNAGMWAVGVALTGNEVGLSWPELQALSAEERSFYREKARSRLVAAGAQVVVDSVQELDQALEQLQALVL